MPAKSPDLTYAKAEKKRRKKKSTDLTYAKALSLGMPSSTRLNKRKKVNKENRKENGTKVERIQRQQKKWRIFFLNLKIKKVLGGKWTKINQKRAQLQFQDDQPQGAKNKYTKK